MTDEEIHEEWLACSESPIYFLHHHCQIEDAAAGRWRPFCLWPAQARTLKTFQNHSLTIVLKARQLGMTWLVLGYSLWLMIFRPAATVLLFSRRDEEAIHLLDDRLKGMYARLPDWLQARKVTNSSAHEWALSNGSVARAFPTSAGDSYTATLAIVDEADLVPNFNRLMRAVKPTIDTGGRMILLSRADKTQPQSEFKAIYRSAKTGTSPWQPVFLPWHVRPERDANWYEIQRADILSRTGSLDDLHEQYPATDAEALSPRSLDKRIPPGWLDRNFCEATPLKQDRWSAHAPSLPGLAIYRSPEPGRRYVIGVDPAEGNPSSDDSAATVLDWLSGEEVASLAGKFQPSTLASYANQVGIYYNRAAVMVERNNHGHAVLLWLRDNGRLKILNGHDEKQGWNSSSLGKSLLYEQATDAFKNDDITLHSFATYMQMASIEGSTLRAPDGEHDDRADSCALAIVARPARPKNMSVLVQAKAKGW